MIMEKQYRNVNDLIQRPMLEINLAKHCIMNSRLFYIFFLLALPIKLIFLSGPERTKKAQIALNKLVTKDNIQLKFSFYYVLIGGYINTVEIQKVQKNVE